MSAAWASVSAVARQLVASNGKPFKWQQPARSPHTACAKLSAKSAAGGAGGASLLAACDAPLHAARTIETRAPSEVRSAVAERKGRDDGGREASVTKAPG